MNQKPYSTLSGSQKRRRLISLKNDNLTANASSNCNEPFEDSSLEDNEISQQECHPSTSHCSPNVTVVSKSNYTVTANEINLPNNSNSEESSSDTCSNYSNEENETLTVTEEDKLLTAIKNWRHDCPLVPSSSVSNLLHHLHVIYPHLPLTCQTLMSESTEHVVISEMHFGRFAFFKNWKECIVKQVASINSNLTTLKINVNIDGIPIFSDARKFHAYPILLQICEIPKKIICFGFYLSEREENNKFPNEAEFLALFIEKMNEVLLNGLTNGNTKIAVKLNAIICDAPMRADLKQAVNHNSYHGCERCSQRGDYAGGHVALLETNAPLRSDDSFLNMMDPEHHRSDSLPTIAHLGVGPVSCFVLDYMHCACLGVMKRLLRRWKASKNYENKCHLSLENKITLDKAIVTASVSLPSEFNRKLSGGLSGTSFWKASEYRLFALYIGIIVLRDVLPPIHYQNFLNFSFAMRLLLSNNQEQNMTSAKSLLLNFITISKHVYGPGFVSYNVHSLLHLPDDYLKYGSLEKISCFPFESYLGQYIKGRITGRNKPFEQICKHVSSQNEKVFFEKNNVDGPNSVYFNDCKISCSSSMGKDNCVMLKNGSIGIVIEINQSNMKVRLFHSISPFIVDPFDSSLVGVFEVKGLRDSEKIAKSLIHSKMVLIPYKKSFVALKLLHSN